ncbi:MAG TPA: hypothetical protein DDY31_00085, partial [Lachnospiraceae bacterium]|nr:hypothetical protein [Lachnospiraceae bacterium]
FSIIGKIGKMQAVVDFFCYPVYNYHKSKRGDEQAMRGGFFMDAVLKVDRDSVMAEIEENQKNVREMVMESYHDMQAGKGRDYKDFFSELESRYDHADI